MALDQEYAKEVREQSMDRGIEPEPDAHVDALGEDKQVQVGIHLIPT